MHILFMNVFCVGVAYVASMTEGSGTIMSITCCLNRIWQSHCSTASLLSRNAKKICTILENWQTVVT